MWDQKLSEDGFSVAPHRFSSSEIGEFLSALENARLPRTRAGIRHALRHSAVAELANGPQLLGLAREILGVSALPYRATLFDKSPASNWLVVWHQDTALPLQERSDVPGWGPWSVKDGLTYAHAPANALRTVLALRLHLDDSMLGNGPLRVLPGTHSQGVLADDDIHELAVQIEAVDCVVPAGGILAMRPLLVHSSSKAVGNMPRRVLHIEYAASQNVGDGMRLAIA